MPSKVSSCFLKSFLGNQKSFLFCGWKSPAYEIGNSTIQPRVIIGKQEFPRVETIRLGLLGRKHRVSSQFPGKGPV